jgi:hypothetical protein
MGYRADSAPPIAYGKREAYQTNDDAAEKRLVGNFCAKYSAGNGLFLMTVKNDEKGQSVSQQIMNAIE